MAHFAQLDENNKVLTVIVVNNEDCLDEAGIESEQVGVRFCENLLGGSWVQTSYNGNIRKQYAGIDFFYDSEKDIFVAPQPYLSWSLDENFDWQAPVGHPGDGNYWWSEEEGNWIHF
jgi:hypothetical protein